MTDLTVFRTYEPWELGKDGYPHVWHANDAHPDAIARWWSGREVCAEPFEHPIDGRVACGLRHGHRGEHRQNRAPWSGPLDDAINDALADAAERGEDPHLDFRLGVKHIVRSEAGNRCVRCGHPFIVGESGTWDDGESEGAVARWHGQEGPVSALFDGIESDVVEKRARATLWSPCDDRCTHWDKSGEWITRFVPEDGGPPIPLPPGLTPADALADDYARPGRIEAAWRILTVHHLNARKHDLRWWNLVSLCQRCHCHIAKKVLMEAVYPFEHTDWFKPYAAGWYAHAYLGQELTREEAAARQDELLALERMA